MSNENEIAIRVNPNIQQRDNLFYATLEHYMEKNPRQQDWKQVPGFVVGSSEPEVFLNFFNLSLFNL
ncbi:MAG: hypothetical protein LH618_15535 [Saprospiraceae bacterium]|nr:hypothetical protein [Saprospiraceae bacterium]